MKKIIFLLITFVFISNILKSQNNQDTLILKTKQLLFGTITFFDNKFAVIDTGTFIINSIQINANDISYCAIHSENKIEKKDMKFNSKANSYNKEFSSGDYLVKASNMFMIGLGLQLTSGLVFATATLNNEKSSDKEYYYAATGLTLVALICYFDAFINIKLAGKKLNSGLVVDKNNIGIGICYKF